MPSKVRDSSSERRKEKTEFRGEKSEKRDRDKDRKHKSSHRKSSTKEKSTSRTSLSSTGSRQRSSMPEVIEEETPVLSDPKSVSAYPPFSRAHSKEAVGSHPALNILTPPATDVNISKEKLAKLDRIVQNGPPSPPLTDKNAGTPRRNQAKHATVETVAEEERKQENSSIGAKLQAKLSTSNGHSRSTSEVGTADSSIKIDKGYAKVHLKNGEYKMPQRSVSQPNKIKSNSELAVPAEVETNVSSDATSIAPRQPNIQRPESKRPSIINKESSQTPVFVGRDIPNSRESTPLEVFVEDSGSVVNTPASSAPPPPPPPPNVPATVPRVDYLLQHGGLHQSVPKNLLYAGKPMAVQQAAMSPGQPPVVVANLFEPYNQLLDDFQKVMSKSGSLAVATGYRSVARRLLDRLEAVFARDISFEYCMCCMCENDKDEVGDIRGVSWGEILELVSGRRDLPSWPPFAFVSSPQGLAIMLDMQAPMQKLDVDVPEEYREHYIRQSRKTKQSVDRWLHRQGNDPSSPPEEVDDETLTFAILTHLAAEKRLAFKNLLGIVDKPIEPPKRAPSPEHNQPPPPTPTPQPKARLEHIVLAGQAIKRLYRLSAPPRDPETAIYMLNNPDMHGPLATLAAVSHDEWDILISGRFDGFLRSGAEDIPEVSPASGRYTPGYQRRETGSTVHGYSSLNASRNISNLQRPGTAPVPTQKHEPSAKYGGPIAFDEETEIATLAEIEREIYVGMEALEDAFEQLHNKAENVRNAILSRSAGLASAAQRRRSAAIEVRMGTPASMNGDGFHSGFNRWESETDDGLGDDVSELAPDDSASNISSARRRRKGGKKRRHERMKTPVIPIEEADEYGAEEDGDDFAESEGTSSPRKR